MNLKLCGDYFEKYADQIGIAARTIMVIKCAKCLEKKDTCLKAPCAMAAEKSEELAIRLIEDRMEAEKPKLEVDSIDWLIDCVNKWVTANQSKNKTVEFFGSFTILDSKKELEVVDDRMIASGAKENIQEDLREFSKQIRKEKEEFINW